MKQLFFILTLLVSLISTPFAEGDVHQHGQANLNIVIDYPYVNFELIAPAASLVGFEHTPHTDREKNLINDAIKDLKRNELLRWYAKTGFFNQKSLLRLSVIEKEVNLLRENSLDSNREHEEKHHHDHHDHHVNHHDDVHDEAHDEHQAHTEQSTHSEFVLKARYQLVSKERPNLLATSIFEYFDLLENLVVTVIEDDQQQHYILSANQSEVKL